MRDVWIIRASNIPHPTDSGVPNPGETWNPKYLH